MDPLNTRDRFGPSFQHFKASLSYLIRDTEKNLSAGVYQANDLAAATPTAGYTAANANLYTLPINTATEEKGFDGIAASPAASRPAPVAAWASSTLRASPIRPASPALAAAARDEFIPPATTTATTTIHSHTHGPSPMATLQSHLATQDTLASLSNDVRSTSESLIGMQGTLQAFKTKMRGAFDANMLTLDKKIRLVRKDILSHISATVQELEKRLAEHIDASVRIGGANETDQQTTDEFRRNVQEEMLFLSSEFAKLTFTTNERAASDERARRSRDHTFTLLQAKVDDHDNRIGEIHSTAYAGEKEVLLLRTELDSLKSKVRREIGHANSDSTVKFVELHKCIAEQKKTMESMIRREEQNQVERADREAHLVAQVNAASQTYLDEQLLNQAATIKTLRRAQVLQQEQMDRMAKEFAAFARRGGGGGGVGTSVLGRSISAAGVGGTTGLANETTLLLDSSDEILLTKTISTFQARLDSLDHALKNERTTNHGFRSELDSLRSTIIQLGDESRTITTNLGRDLREDLRTIEKDGLTRETTGRAWREEMNTWSRGMEQTVMNIKYAMAQSPYTGGPASSSPSVGSGGMPSHLAPFLDHPSTTPLSQALTALDQRTSTRIASVEKMLSEWSTKEEESKLHAAAASAAAGPVYTTLIHSLDSRLEDLRAQITTMSNAWKEQATTTSSQIAEMNTAIQQNERERQQAEERAAQATASVAADAAAAAAAAASRASSVPSSFDASHDQLLSDLTSRTAELSSTVHDLAEVVTTSHSDTLRMVQGRLESCEEVLGNMDQRLHSLQVRIEQTEELTTIQEQDLVQVHDRTHIIERHTEADRAELTAMRQEVRALQTLAHYQHSLQQAADSNTNPHQVLAATNHANATTTNINTGVQKLPLLPRTVSASSAAAAIATANSPTHTANTATLNANKQASTPAPASAQVERVPDSPAISRSPQKAPVRQQQLGDDGFESSPSSDEDDEDAAARPTAAAATSAAPQPYQGRPAPFQARPLIDVSSSSSPAVSPRILVTPPSDGPHRAPAHPSSANLSVSPSNMKASPKAGPPLPRHPGSASTSPLHAKTATTPTNAAAATLPASVAKPTAALAHTKPNSMLTLDQAPEESSSDDDDDFDEAESSSENLAKKYVAATIAKKSHTPTSAAATATSTLAPATAALKRPLLPSSSAGTAMPLAHAAGGPIADDGDSTNGVPHSILSKQVKQRYLDAAAAGMVDGEAEIDEDSLYDPEDDGSGSSRTITQHQQQQQHGATPAKSHTARAYDDDHLTSDDSFDEAARTRQHHGGYDLNDTLDDETDQSLNTKFRHLQQSARQDGQRQYAAAHQALHTGANTGHWDSDDEEDESSDGAIESPYAPAGGGPYSTGSGRAPPGASMLGPGFSPSRKPLSNPGLDGHPSVSPLSPLGKPTLKSNLGSVRPTGAVNAMPSAVPSFMKPPLGATNAAGAHNTQLPQTYAQSRTLAGRQMVHGGGGGGDDFDYDDEFDDDPDLLSSLSTDYRNFGGPNGPRLSSDEDLSSPRPEDLLTPAAHVHKQGPGGRTNKPQQQHQQRHAHAHEQDEDEMSGLFEHTHGDDEEAGGSVASYVSELDQMELSASHDFNSSY